MPIPVATSIVWIEPNAGITVARHSVRATAVFPSGVPVCYVPVGNLTGDDQVIVCQRAQTTGTGPIEEAKVARDTGANSGKLYFKTGDNANIDAATAFEFVLHRNG